VLACKFKTPKACKMAEQTANMTLRLRDVFDSWYSELIEERYTHPVVQCDACLKACFLLSFRNDVLEKC
jgi:hypothetical protein